MIIGNRLRELREGKNLSQGDVEKRTGLLRCYTSRVENGHTIPTLETLEKYAGALDVPLYRFFYAGEVSSGIQKFFTGENFRKPENEAGELRHFRRAFAKMSPRDRALLLALAAKMARKTDGSKESIAAQDSK